MPIAMARAIERALTDDECRAVLIAAGARAAKRWTWANVARDTLDVLSAQGRRWPQRLRSPRRIVAVAGPFAGSASGIGRYDESVLGGPASSDGYDRRTRIVGTRGWIGLRQSRRRRRSAGDRRAMARAIGRFFKPWDVDHIVAALGSSPHHAATADLTSRAPCHVWLHETSLVGLHVGLAHASGSETWALDHVRSVITASESVDLASAIGDDELLDAEGLHRAGVTMLSPTIETARSVIVSSEQAAATVRRMSPSGPPVLVLPLAHPPGGAPRTPPRALEIVAAGWLADNKAPMLALELLARLREIDGVTLAFVGPATRHNVSRRSRRRSTN